MKSKDLILLAIIGIGGYFLLTRGKGIYDYLTGGLAGGGGTLPPGMTTPDFTTPGIDIPGTTTGLGAAPIGYNITRDVTGQTWLYPSNVFIKAAAGPGTEQQKLKQISKSLPPGTREKIVVSKILAGKI